MNSQMQFIKLNKHFGELVKSHGYVLDPRKKYVIDLDLELDMQYSSILPAVKIMGLPALSDYHNWLRENGFSVENPNPTNDFVSKYYGKKELWKTDLSLGIVVKDMNTTDYYIVMECSRLNEGFKYTQIILTLGGCI